MGKSRRSLSRPTTKIEEELKVVNESSLKLLIAEALKAQEEIHGDEIKALTAELLEIKSSQEFLCNEFDKLKSECQTLRAINKQQAEEITQLKANSAKLESKGKTEENKWMYLSSMDDSIFPIYKFQDVYCLNSNGVK